MKKGIIIKGIGGFYDVKLDDDVLRCNARGKFKKTVLFLWLAIRLR